MVLFLAASGDGVRADECQQTGCPANASLSGCREVCGTEGCSWVSDISVDLVTCGGATYVHQGAPTAGVTPCVGQYEQGQLVAYVPPPTWAEGVNSQTTSCMAWSGCADPSNDPVCGDADAANGCGSFPRDCEPEPSEGDSSGAGGGQGRQDTQSCEDLAGTDPIHLSTKSAVTEPFTDFEYQGLSSIKLQRTYSSADKSVPKPKGGRPTARPRRPGSSVEAGTTTGRRTSPAGLREMGSPPGAPWCAVSSHRRSSGGKPG